MKYTVAEFRKNTRKILDAVDQGAEVHIQRYDQTYQIVPVVRDTDNLDAFAYAIGVDPAKPGADRTVIVKPRAIGKTMLAKKALDLADPDNTILENGKIVKKNVMVAKATKKKAPAGIREVSSCPHGYAIGNCKKEDCNRKYRA